MKKEVMDILQNELVFDRLSGSAGDITPVSMGNKHYYRKKGKTECPNTERQQIHHQVLRHGVAAWRSLAMDKQKSADHESYVERQYNIGAVRMIRQLQATD